MLIYNGYLGCSPLYPSVDVLLKWALKHDTPNWRLLNACPPCTYKLVDEPSLQFDWFAMINGNNSLKRWASSIYNSFPRDDSHQPRMDYWIDCNVVDKFKDEVRSRTALDKNDDWEDIHNDKEVPGEIPFNCIACWWNSGPEQCKKMFSVFNESGIFIAECRHWFILVACDMVCSGELAKYPLAILDRLMTVYGQNGACAYDIGCAFSKTLSTSSLGSRAHMLTLCIMMGVFHRHAHNCNGTGHTEGKGCEHTFSSSNELAQSNFLYNHYQELSVIKDQLNLDDADFVKFYAKEKLYLEQLKEPPIRDCLSANNALTTVRVSNFAEISATLTTARICVDAAYAKLQNAEALVTHMEIQLCIEEHWAIRCPEYVQFKEEASLGKYHAVLNELEHLVVMRLFELLKLSLSGTGYKLCQQIGKALQCCSEAIRNAINRYNTQAAVLNLPHPKLSWKDIAEYSFVGEFDLLHHSSTDVRELDWMKPAHYEATTKYFKLLCDQEEVSHLNVEEIETKKVIEDLQSSNPLLASELQ
ncbi:hypothetical protein DFH29DRAFT_983794 [Suillus ampliporus]|nr:hypothetical protein DFH29DRAFT_983794 [Suillus ampliporus]